MEHFVTKELLKKYINHHQMCTPNELLEIVHYINTSKGKTELEQVLLEEWLSFNPDQSQAHEAELWHHKIISSSKKKQLRLGFIFNQWARYAAILVFVLGSLFFTTKTKKSVTPEESIVEWSNPTGQRSRITLPDSSIVYLGPGSRLSYSRSFVKEKRDVTLNGDAFFEVKHDTQKPFVVHTGNLETQVLGTSFNVDAIDPQKTAVSVATGRVGIINTDPKNKIRETLAILTPGQRISWDKTTKQLLNDRLDLDEINSLKTGLITFSNESLENIAVKLARWYNIKITISSSEIRKYMISIKVDGNKSINGALDAISVATKLKYKIHKHQIIIS